MADFQSFLFRNIQTIGLEQESNDPTLNVVSLTKNLKLLKAPGQILKPGRSEDEEKQNRNCFANNSKHNSHQAKIVENEKASRYFENMVKADDLMKSNHKFYETDQKILHALCADECLRRVERSYYDDILNRQEPAVRVKQWPSKRQERKEMLSRIKENENEEKFASSSSLSSSSRVLSSPQFKLKRNPVSKDKKSRESTISERDVKSPEAPKQRSKTRNFFNKISTKNLKGIFSRAASNYETKEKIAELALRSEDGAKLASVKEDSRSSADEAGSVRMRNNKNADKSSDSILFEPFLEEFEAELLRSSKSDMFKGLDEKKFTSGFVQKYLSELKSLKAKNEKSKSTAILQETTKAKIPWNELKVDSADLLVDFFAANSNCQVRASIQPEIFYKNGKKVDTNLVKKWLKALEKARKAEAYELGHFYETREAEVFNAKNLKESNEKFLDFGKFYAQKVREKMKEARQSNDEPRKTHYENDEFLKRLEIRNLGTDVPRKDSEHLYNEIQEQASRRTRKDPAGASQLKNSSLKTANVSFGSDLASNKSFSGGGCGGGGGSFLWSASKRSFSTLAKLKSPERRILYKEWFDVIKKMEKDPKFDLEALIRTRGRFTEHERISYRDRLIEQRLRCAQSEPSFAIDDSDSVKMLKCRGEIYTAPTNKTRRKKPLTRNFSALEPSQQHSARVKSESFSVGSKRNETRSPSSNGRISPVGHKLTLHKHDVRLIQQIIKKKDKQAIAEIKEMREQARSTHSADSQLTSNQKKNSREEFKNSGNVKTRGEREARIRQNESGMLKNARGNSTLELSAELEESFVSKWRSKGKFEGAKVFCNEFSKIGSKIKSFASNSKLASKILNSTHTESEYEKKAKKNRDATNLLTKESERRRDEKRSEIIKSRSIVEKNQLGEESFSERRARRGETSGRDRQPTKISEREEKLKWSKSPSRPPPPKRPPPPRPAVLLKNTNRPRKSDNLKNLSREFQEVVDSPSPVESSSKLVFPPRPPLPPLRERRQEPHRADQFSEISVKPKRREEFMRGKDEKRSERMKRSSSCSTPNSSPQSSEASFNEHIRMNARNRSEERLGFRQPFGHTSAHNFRNKQKPRNK